MKAITAFLQSHLPYDRMRALYPERLFGGYRWKGDDEQDRKAALYALTSFYDPQSVGFMVDLLPYFFDILREDDPTFRKTEVTKVLDVGARTAAGTDLLGQVFAGIWSRRPMVVDVVDIDDTFKTYVEETKTFVRHYMVQDVADIPDGAYDYVFASHVMEHIPDLPPYARTLQRIARKRVICYTPYNEIDPIVSHHTVDDAALDAIGAQGRVISDTSWFWKNENKKLDTVMFWLPGTGGDGS